LTKRCAAWAIRACDCSCALAIRSRCYTQTETLPNSALTIGGFKIRATILWHTGRMAEDQLFLSPAKAPPVGISEDLYWITDDLDFLKAQLAQIPRRQELWRAVVLGMIIAAGVSVTLAEALSRACS
jgi:hypothetical protein